MDYIDQFTQSLTEQETNLDYHMDLSTQRIGELAIAFYKQNIKECEGQLTAVKKGIQFTSQKLAQYRIPEIVCRFSLSDIFENDVYHDIEIGFQYQSQYQSNEKNDYFKSLNPNSFGNDSETEQLFKTNDESNNKPNDILNNELSNNSPKSDPTENQFYLPNLDKQALSLGHFAQQINQFLVEHDVEKEQADMDSIFMASCMALSTIYTLSKENNKASAEISKTNLENKAIPEGHYLFKLNVKSYDFCPGPNKKQQFKI